MDRKSAYLEAQYIYYKSRQIGPQRNPEEGCDLVRLEYQVVFPVVIPALFAAALFQMLKQEVSLRQLFVVLHF